jgi:uncharacterized membrane-anchored protein
MNNISKQIVSKVPAVTIGFWIIKILCTTLGETGGDAVTMTFGFGYLVGTFIFLGLLLILVVMQMRAKNFNRWLYWGTIMASTTAGTTMADFFDRSLGIGYFGGSLVLFACLLFTLFLWKWSCGTIYSDHIKQGKGELFYWITITFSQTLGTALGDYLADTNDFGYVKASLVFGAGLAVVALLYYQTKISPVLLFWSAFILTRPLGATIGDFLDKPYAKGGLALGRVSITLLLLVAVIVSILLFSQKREKLRV